VHKGSDRTKILLGVLLRFREQSVAVIGEIETMRHQVLVSPHHRDLLQFFWWSDGDVRQPPDIYRMTVHLFGGSSNSSSTCFAPRHITEDYQNEIETQVLTVQER